LVNIIQYENANILQSFLDEQPNKVEISNDLLHLDYENPPDWASNVETLLGRNILNSLAMDDLKKKNMPSTMNKSTLSSKLKIKTVGKKKI
jgi:hypothetical protein